MSDLGRRVAAARHYAGLRQSDIAKRLEVDVQTVKRMEAGNRDPRRPELLALADACGLPLEFFTVPFDRLATAPPSIAERLAAIESAVLPLSELERDESGTLLRLRPPNGRPNEEEGHEPQRKQGG